MLAAFVAAIVLWTLMGALIVRAADPFVHHHPRRAADFQRAFLAGDSELHHPGVARRPGQSLLAAHDVLFSSVHWDGTCRRVNAPSSACLRMAQSGRAPAHGLPVRSGAKDAGDLARDRAGGDRTCTGVQRSSRGVPLSLLILVGDGGWRFIFSPDTRPSAVTSMPSVATKRRRTLSGIAVNRVLDRRLPVDGRGRRAHGVHDDRLLGSVDHDGG